MPYTVLDTPLSPPSLPWRATLPHTVNIRVRPSADPHTPILRTAKAGESLILIELVLGVAVGTNGTLAWYRVEGGGFVYGGVVGPVVSVNEGA